MSIKKKNRKSIALQLQVLKLFSVNAATSAPKMIAALESSAGGATKLQPSSSSLGR